MMHEQEQTIAWSFPEHEHHHRAPGWYITAGAAALGLFIFAIITANFLFASIIIFVALIIALQHYHHPLTVDFAISPDGITLQERASPWKDIKSFWIIYEPPEVKNLYFEFKGLRPRLRVPLQDQSPLMVRDALLPYLEEDLEKENEPLSDGIARVFKL